MNTDFGKTSCGNLICTLLNFLLIRESTSISCSSPLISNSSSELVESTEIRFPETGCLNVSVPIFLFQPVVFLEPPSPFRTVVVRRGPIVSPLMVPSLSSSEDFCIFSEQGIDHLMDDCSGMRDHLNGVSLQATQ